MAHDEYIAGVCNIGPEEIARRRIVGWGSLVITLVIFIVLVWSGVNPLWRVFIFFPAALSAAGFLQAYFHFCAGFARMGVFNFDAVGQTEHVTDESAKTQDKKRGRQITLYAVLIGMVITIIAVMV